MTGGLKNHRGAGHVTFKIEGDRKSGFVYSAKMDGRDIKEITGSLKDLTREDVETMFANYVAGK